MSSKQKADILEMVSTIRHWLRELLQRISRAEELADTLAYEFTSLEEAVGALVNGNSFSLANGNHAKLSPQPLNRILKESSAFSLDIKLLADGSAKIRIDLGKEFIFPPLLAELLNILSADTCSSEDDFICWKSIAEVGVLLGKRIGRQITRHALTQNISRLRKEFLKNGVNPFLIQTNRLKGARFALRRKIVL